MRATAATDGRVLVMMPPSRVVPVLEALAAAGVRAEALEAGALARGLRAGAGVLVAEVPADDAALGALAGALASQPAWSDLPVVLVEAGDDAATSRALAALGDVQVLEGLASPEALVRMVRAALRMRAHQRRLRNAFLPPGGEGALHTYFDLPGAGAVQVDPRTFRFVRVNRRFCELTGYAEHELLGMRVADVTHPDDHASDEAALRAVLSGEREVWTIEKRYVRKDGRVRWVQVAGQLVRDDAGEPLVTVATVVDIDERVRLFEAWRRREQELRESEARFRRLADAAPVLIWQAGLDRKCVWFNQRWLAFTGRTMAQELGDGWTEGVHPADLERCVRTYVEAFDARRPFEMEYRLRRHDGQWRWLLDHGAPIETPDGQFAGFIGSCYDVTERRAAEQALRRSDEFHAVIAELASDFAFTARVEPGGVMVIDGVTEGFQRVLGWTPAELMAEGGWAATVHPQDREEFARRMARLLAGEPMAGVIRQFTRDGRSLRVQYRTRPVRDGDGRVVRIYGASRDITAQFELQQALLEGDRQKDEFLATLAHELRNPLAPLRNSLHVLRARPGDPATAERVLGMMDRQVSVLVRLVDDLLEISRISRGKIVLHRERLALADAVQAAVETVRPLVEAAGHQLTVSLPADPVWLDADRVRLAQVIANLLSNAAKYTPGGGAIALDVRLEDAMVELAVRDTGVGIPSEELERIFDLFVQVDQSRARAQGGLGIGLTLVRKLVELHGGLVTASSAGPGEGSTFTVRLPRVSASAHEGSGLDGGAPDEAWPAARLLIVDDNVDAAESLALVLRDKGLAVTVAHGGPGALALLDEARPDVVLLDIGMPGMDGYEVARRIRQAPGHEGVRVFALSGYGNNADRRRSRESGFDGHLVKPVRLEQLRALLGDRRGWRATGTVPVPRD
jgi:PAS domain S-box-containing protein